MIEAKGNIIITGFQGFIGIYTTAKFMNEGDIVHGVDIGKVDKKKISTDKKAFS
jgi:nucleoside-diphosphate-sugar epimerase